jgi:hypothetical protein
MKVRIKKKISCNDKKEKVCSYGLLKLFNINNKIVIKHNKLPMAKK